MGVYEEKVCVNDCVSRAGFSVNTVTKEITAQDILKTSLNKMKDGIIKSMIIQSVKPILYSTKKLTDVYIFTSSRFDEFRQLASFVLDERCKDERELFLMGNVLFTTHKDFTFGNVKGQGDTTDYNSREVYCIRLVHKEIKRDEEIHKVDEILIYIPYSYFVG